LTADLSSVLNFKRETRFFSELLSSTSFAITDEAKIIEPAKAKTERSEFSFILF